MVRHHKKRIRIGATQLTQRVEITVDDDVVIIRHDLGDLQFDKRNHYMKGRCVGRQGFQEQMLLLHLLQHRRKET